MLTIHEWVKGMRLCRTRALFLSTACASICQSCIQVIPSTGEPCAGDPHARFGGEGDREFNRSSLPLSPWMTGRSLCVCASKRQA